MGGQHGTKEDERDNPSMEGYWLNRIPVNESGSSWPDLQSEPTFEFGVGWEDD